MTEDKISVLVSVYNKGSFLDECIASVVKQTYKNWELILVDDGSTDNSLAVAQKWVDRDARIRLVQQDHKGPCAARNRAIELAEGQYYFFLDADDFLNDTCLDRLARAVQEEDADVAAANYYDLNNGVFYFHLENKEYYQKKFTIRDWFTKMPNNGANGFDVVFVSLCGKLFSKKLFTDLLMPEDELIDDAYTTWKLYLQANAIVYCNFEGYCYRANPESLSHTVKQFSVDDVEEQFAMLAMIGFPLTEIERSYSYQLYRIRRQALNSGNYQAYKDACLKLKIIHKYQKEKELLFSK